MNLPSAMIITPLPAANQRAEHGVSVDVNRFDETTGDRLVETIHMPRAYACQQASAVQRAYAAQTARIAAANKKAVWNDNLNKNVLLKIILNFPHAPAVNDTASCQCLEG